MSRNIVLFMALALAGCQSGPAADNPPAAAAAADPLAEAAQNVRLVGLQRSAGTHGARRDDEVRRGERKLGVRRPPRELRRREAAAQPDHRKDGVERHVDSRDLRSGQAEARLAHSERDEQEFARRVGGLRLQVRLVGPRLPDSQLRSADPGRDRAPISSTRSSTSPRGTATRRRSRWCRRSPARRRTRAAAAAAASSSCARTRAGGREETGYFYAASGEPGFRNVIIQIFDLKNPKEPKLVGRAWLPGLKDGEPGYEGQYSHHPVVDEENKRLYVGYRNAGGQAASFDISNPAQPKLVWSIDMNPPHRGPHTVSPIVYDDGAELREERPSADLRLHRRRGRRRRRHEAVPERRATRHRTCSTSRRRRSRSRCRCGRCPSATSARRAGASGRTSQRRP